MRIHEAQTRRNRRIIENFRKLLKEMRQKEGGNASGSGEIDATKFVEEVGRVKEALAKQLNLNDPRNRL